VLLTLERAPPALSATAWTAPPEMFYVLDGRVRVLPRTEIVRREKGLRRVSVSSRSAWAGGGVCVTRAAVVVSLSGEQVEQCVLSARGLGCAAQGCRSRGARVVDVVFFICFGAAFSGFVVCVEEFE